MVSNNLFITCYRQYNLGMTLDDQKDFLDFMALGAQKNHFNLANLSKLFDVLAKLTYSS